MFFYDKQLDKVLSNSIENICEENYFFKMDIKKIYDSLSDEDKKAINEACIKDGYKTMDEMTDEETLDLEYAIDDMYSDIYEPEFQNMIRLIKKRISNKARILLTKEEKFKMSDLFTLLFIRTKWFRENITESKVSILKQTIPILAQFEGLKIDSDDLKIQYTKLQKKIFHMRALVDTKLRETITNIFSVYTWVFLTLDKGSFFLPDKLINMCPTEPFPPMFPPGLDSYGMIIEIPMSKDLLLVMLDSRKHKGWNDCEHVPFNIISQKLYSSANMNSVKCSYRYVYSNDEELLKNTVNLFKKEINRGNDSN